MITRFSRRLNPHRSGDCRGIVMLEFLVALIPMMLAFLGAVQFTFVASAKLLVAHSAHMATRAAIVVVEESAAVPGTPQDLYGGSPAGRIEASAGGGGAAPDARANPVEGGAVPTEQLRSLLGAGHDRSRLDLVRTAAYLPLLIASPSSAALGLPASPSPAAGPRVKWAQDDFVGAALPGPDQARLASALAYNRGMVAVTFPGTQGRIAPGQDVTVRVSYLFRCQVPLVSLMLCDSGEAVLNGNPSTDVAAYWDLGGPPGSSSHGTDQAKARYAAAKQRLHNISQANGDWSSVESPTSQHQMLRLPGARFILLQAEATLPAQSARYYPRG